MTLLPAAVPYEFAVEIEATDIDFMGHVNNAIYLKWVQAAVISHWQSIATAEEVVRHLWVALKHEITYRKPGFLNDPIIASVMLEKVQGPRAFYETIVRRGSEVLAEVRSSWCCLDATTLRPVRIGKAIIDRLG